LFCTLPITLYHPAALSSFCFPSLPEIIDCKFNPVYIAPGTGDYYEFETSIKAQIFAKPIGEKETRRDINKGKNPSWQIRGTTEESPGE
jgi:hypothetical protein